jgi:hypothetical protein
MMMMMMMVMLMLLLMMMMKIAKERSKIRFLVFIEACGRKWEI